MIVTATAVQLLIDDGKLSMQQRLAEVLPACSGDGREAITLAHMLTHTSGLPSGIAAKPAWSGKEEALRRACALSPTDAPGTAFRYSDVNFILLGAIVERASGESLDTFAARRIFAPLGMTSTWFQVPESQMKRLTTNYFQAPFGAFPIDPGNDSVYFDKPAFPFGGAGLVSSPRDYDRFLAMLMGEGALDGRRIMKRETAQLAMSNLVHPDTKMESFVKGQGFGAGGRVTIAASPSGEGIGTFGWGGAASTIAWADRTRGIRASGWSQIMTMGEQPFTIDFGKAVYASMVS